MPVENSAHVLPPWVIVCGGFHRHGGMDRANFALAESLAQQGRNVHLVCHDIEESLLASPNVTAHIVPRPFGSTLFGERSLQRVGQSIAESVTKQFHGTRVVVNGGNCVWPDINWVHSVHSAWPAVHVSGAPLWFRTKSSINKRKAIADERRAFLQAKLFIVNSKRTKQDLIALGIAPEKIHIIYLGSDPDWRAATPEQKTAARAKFQLPPDARVLSFVGALGYDRNKGFDTLLEAFRKIDASHIFLLAAGGGRGLEYWRNEVGRIGLAERVRLIGFTPKIEDVYDASDLLVSPVRYEAYGLNVHEAICRSVPTIVSASAGVAESYTSALERFLLRHPESSEELQAKIEDWLRNPLQAARDFEPLSCELRARSWRHMADQIIAVAEDREPASAEVRR